MRYDSLNDLQGKPSKFLRPRVLVYAGFWALFMALAAFSLGQRRPFEATLIRQQGSPYVLERGQYRNSYLLHVFNKTPHAARFAISLVLPAGARAIVPVPLLQLESLKEARVPLDVELPVALWKGEFVVLAQAQKLDNGAVVESQLRFLGPP